MIVSALGELSLHIRQTETSGPRYIQAMDFKVQSLHQQQYCHMKNFLLIQIIKIHLPTASATLRKGGINFIDFHFN